MADIKKFLNADGVSHLWSRITAEVAKEAARADAAEKVNAKAIADEIARAKAAEQVNATAVATEQARAEGKEGELAKAIADEATRAKGAEATNAAAAKAAQDDVDAVEKDLGSVDSLSTTNKTVVGAINEVLAAVGTGGTAATVTITTDTTTTGALKSYTVKQGNTTVGVIDIPKDMVVESGEVVTNPEGQAEGTYIKLVLANVAKPLYINVGRLVDIYTVEAQATQVQLSIVDNKISAAIVAGSVTATELAANAVTTEKIADTNVTKAKLATTVQTSLNKADSAVQKEEVVTGETAGTIKVQGNEVAVAGLGSAAFADTTAFDAAGAAAAAEATAAADATAKANKALEDAKADATKKANAAEKNAKDYADAEIAKIQALTNAEIDTAIGYVAPQA